MQQTITIPPNNAQNRSKHLAGEGKKKPNAAQKDCNFCFGYRILLRFFIVGGAGGWGNTSKKETPETICRSN
jgi:hypothetical protein